MAYANERLQKLPIGQIFSAKPQFSDAPIGSIQIGFLGGGVARRTISGNLRRMAAEVPAAVELSSLATMARDLISNRPPHPYNKWQLFSATIMRSTVEPTILRRPIEDLDSPGDYAYLRGLVSGHFCLKGHFTVSDGNAREGSKAGVREGEVFVPNPAADYEVTLPALSPRGTAILLELTYGPIIDPGVTTADRQAEHKEWFDTNRTPVPRHTFQ